MATTGTVTIKIEGEIGNIRLSPENFDISYLRELLGYAEELLQYDRKRTASPVVLDSIKDGCVITVLKASAEKTMKFAAILAMLSSSVDLNQFEGDTAKALGGLQDFSIKNNFTIGMSTSVNSAAFSITPTSGLKPADSIWAEAEMYYYGSITTAGGKQKSTIRINTASDGVLNIETGRPFLENQKDNLLYREYGVRVAAMQNLITGEIDKSSLKLIELIDYNPVYDKEYLDGKINSSTPNWQGVDADEFIHELREGGYV